MYSERTICLFDLLRYFDCRCSACSLQLTDGIPTVMIDVDALSRSDYERIALAVISVHPYHSKLRVFIDPSKLTLI